MQNKTFSLCIALDKNGWDSQELISFDSLYTLDKYIKEKFTNHLDVREEFDQEIGEFCLIYRKRIIEENKRNHNNRTGHIVILEKNYDKNGKLRVIRPIKVMYKNLELSSRRECIRKIKKALEDDDKLYELYERKNYLLTQNEKDLIRIYKKFHYLKRKEETIYFLTDRILHASPKEAYYYCRSLSNLCDLLKEVIAVSKGKIKNISEKKIKEPIILENKPKEYKLEEKPDFLDTGLENEYIINLMENGNYDELFNLYGLEEIEKAKRLIERRK